MFSRSELHFAISTLRVIEIKNLIVALNGSCSTNIRRTGNKAELATHIVNAVDRWFIVGNVAYIRRASAIFESHRVNYKLTDHLGFMPSSDSSNSAPRSNSVSTVFAPNYPQYATSPFYTIVSRLSNARVAPSCPMSRNSCSFTVYLTPDQIQHFQDRYPGDNQPYYQIRLFCAANVSSQSKLSVEYPSTCEIRVNQVHVVPNAKLRGLRGRPNTVHPADITSYFHLGTQKNTIDFVYANTDRSYITSVELIRRVPVPEIVTVVKSSRVIGKEETLRRLQERNEDADIVLESETISTKCPLGFTRIVTPGKSRHCPHIQCFDLTTFLLMNEQTPTWNCPICNRVIPWEDLVVDGYFTDILEMVGNVESMQVDNSGQLKILTHEDDDNDSDSDGDGLPKIKSERQQSASQPPEGSQLITIEEDEEGGHPEPERDNIPPAKRARLEAYNNHINNSIVDLTFSSDEDEEPLHHHHPPSASGHHPPVPATSDASSTTTTTSVTTAINTNLPNNNVMNPFNPSYSQAFAQDPFSNYRPPHSPTFSSNSQDEASSPNFFPSTPNQPY
ncbi:hypothetical protein DM01DRAFT_1382770 [Hesseltinella vesiculosa]|uniref:Zf-MIZ-domain-containing protein n=1 Tax=Hesseltinella vesiculosa TaxID=101127 RepID=A0A1X2GK10_9FUNG|nr:hypothetical protein DM01DRAFT_1382770 [Hesseltinella vesiculosa]